MITSWLGDEASRDARTLFAAKGIASFATPAEAVDGFMQLVRYARAQEELMRTPPSLPDGSEGRSRRRPHATIKAAIAAGRSVLSEVEAKALLAAYGIPVVPTEVARDPAEVGAWRPALDRASTAPAWSRSFPTTSRISPMSAACGWAWSAPKRRATRGRGHAAAHRARHAGGAHRGLHGAADDPPPARARADPRHVGRRTRSGRC